MWLRKLIASAERPTPQEAKRSSDETLGREALWSLGDRWHRRFRQPSLAFPKPPRVSRDDLEIGVEVFRSGVGRELQKRSIS